MMRFLIAVVIFLAAAAVGLFVADLVLDDFSVTWTGFIQTVVIFALIQAIVSPLMFNLTRKYASAFIGGVGLLATYVALLITSLIGDSLTITGLSTWIAAVVIVWLAAAIAAWVLPFIFVKKKVARARS